MNLRGSVVLQLIACGLGFWGCQESDRVVQRPERITSKREVVYDTETYAELDSLWRGYYAAYPSEEAYANWMYAARYADNPDYSSLLDDGVRLYPANPTLLYLKSMVRHGQAGNLEALSLLERAVELDPSYKDPWFSLVIHYLERGEREKTDVALRKILESGAIADEVMDFSYNMLAGLEKNAILVTNGDNDTYPGWILARVTAYRPDVTIVNHALLNTDWYPLALQSEGIPNLISPGERDSLMAAFIERLKEKKLSPGSGGPLSDHLIDRLITAAGNAGRPVYFAATLQHTDAVKRHLASGRTLGLATLVTPAAKSDREHMREAVDIWVREFRTGGLDSWTLRYARQSRAGKMLVMNYAAALQSQMDRIVTFAPESRRALFRWYRDHLASNLPAYRREHSDRMWCRSDDIGEIREWCRKMNLSK